MTAMFAEVILAKVAPGIDKIYHYSIPQELVSKARVGSQVLVPFGAAKRVGYIVNFAEKSDVKGIKDIAEVLSPNPLFTKEAVDAAKWMSNYYNSFLMTAIRTVLPPGTTRIEDRALKKKLKKPLYEVRSKGSEVRTSNSALRTSNFTLTGEQQVALDSIIADMGTKTFKVSLLYGITGSGKTEVYLRAIKHSLSKGGSAILLVPEVGLTPQIIERAREHFGDDLKVYYSDMSEKARMRVWDEVVSQERSIVLGTRSALFLPVKDLKVIVIDEEYENTYKSDQSPRYHAREVAFHMAEGLGIPVVLGSATPSIESYYHAQKGEYRLLKLTKRIDDRPLPPVEVVDMRKEMKARNFGVLSTKLRDAIKSTFEKGQQSILFINRRGYFSFVMCRECGYTLQCPKCERSLTYYMNEKKLICNHCGFSTEAPVICPKCQSSSIKFFGGGTQRIQQEVAQIIPRARILRLDRDTVNRKGAYETIIKSFVSGSGDVLIGTQMVTKGLDVSTVTLVGVVAADIGLNIPDFRASEHTFQLITQVAGRAGRHHLPGEVIVQTYNPDHYAIKYASAHDYEGFYAHEIKVREELRYPPFASMINIIVSASSDKDSNKVGEDLVRFISKRLEPAQGDVFGPASAPINKLKGMFRQQIMLQGEDLAAMRKAVVESVSGIVKLGRTRVTVDIDPYSML